jgi:hypothetical protein
MNSQAGLVTTALQSLTKSYNPGFVTFAKLTDIPNSPGPSQTFIFCEENICSINDGYLQVSCQPSPETFPDVPGSYHIWAAGLSFADGHAELHKWVTGILKIAVRYGYNQDNVIAGVNNADWLWFTQHATCPAP